MNFRGRTPAPASASSFEEEKMFTVSHEKPDGTRAFHKVIRPQFVPAKDGQPAFVDCLDGEGVEGDAPLDVFIGQLFGGTVYIMNEKGATVGTFRLGR